MKTLFTNLAVAFSILGFGQIKSVNGLATKEAPKMEDITVTITVDSAEEIEYTFKMKDIKEILEITENNKALSFKIICNDKKMSNGEASYVSYGVEGNTNKSDKFLQGVEKTRISAINYYKN